MTSGPMPLDRDKLAEHLVTILNKHGVVNFTCIVEDPDQGDIFGIKGGELDMSAHLKPKLTIVSH